MSRIILWIGLLVTPFVFADDRGNVKVLMHTFFMEMGSISPYLASPDTFSSEEGRAKVGEAISRMERAVRKPPADLKETPGYRIGIGLLSDHLNKTKVLLEKGEYEYARLRLNGTSNLCIGCHTQTPKIGRFSAFASLKGQFEKVSFENANFLFVTRRYDEALEQFDVLIRKFPDNQLSPEQLNEVYRRKISLFARVLRDPQRAISSLNEDLKNTKLPRELQPSIKDWIGSFEKWKSEKKDPATSSTTELVAFAAKTIPEQPNRKVALTDPQLVNLLRVSGLLYERLHSDNAKAETQALLYYLALCERSLSPHYWYSLSEIYLKECVVKYPKKSFTKRCYDAYQAGMNERFAGRPMPEPIQESIKAMKDYL